MSIKIRKYLNNKKVLATIVVIWAVIFTVQILTMNNLIGEENKNAKGGKNNQPGKVDKGPLKHDLRSNPDDRTAPSPYQNWPRRKYSILDPFQEMRMMQEEMDKLFNQTFNRFRLSPGFTVIDQNRMFFSPRADIKDNGKNYVVQMDVPGVDRSNIKIKVRNRLLTISGRRENKTEEKSDNVLRMERRIGEFSRTFSLPGPIDDNNIKAKCKNGVLTVTVPKTEKDQEEIEVKVE